MKLCVSDIILFCWNFRKLWSNRCEVIQQDEESSSKESKAFFLSYTTVLPFEKNVHRLIAMIFQIILL